jgi:hypothetical protein
MGIFIYIPKYIYIYGGIMGKIHVLTTFDTEKSTVRQAKDIYLRLRLTDKLIKLMFLNKVKSPEEYFDEEEEQYLSERVRKILNKQKAK